eukprot:1389397-Prymnesium_polylepis.1
MSAQRGGMGACATQAVAVCACRGRCFVEPRRTSMFCTCSRRLRGRIRPPRRTGASVARWGAAA